VSADSSLTKIKLIPNPVHVHHRFHLSMPIPLNSHVPFDKAIFKRSHFITTTLA
jgi:hypothetical protein